MKYHKRKPSIVPLFLTALISALIISSHKPQAIVAAQNKPAASIAVKAVKASEAALEAPKQPISPPPAPAAPAPSGIGCEQYRPLIAKYGWNVNVAMAVMKAESGCNPDIVGPTNDHGLFQLHNIPVYNPAENVRIAYEVKYLTQGWQAWSVCNRGIVSCF